MMMHQPSPDFRRRAERRHHGRRLEDTAARNADTDRLLHELQVHQIELEMQNDELRQARSQVEEALERYTELYDRAPVGYLTLNQGGTILRLNFAAARLLGGERNALVGKSFRQFLAEREQDAFSAFLFLVKNGDGPAGCELSLQAAGPDGEPRHIQIEAVPDKGGQGVSLIALDITEKKKAHEELVRSNLELKQFAYVAAHDLQTPLRSISGFAQLLQGKFQGRLDTQADDWIHQLVHHVHRMQSLIHDLLEYSSVDARGRPFKPVDLAGIFDEVVAAARQSIRESGATVTRGDLPTVLGDRLQLAQVMQNLIDNAIKYHGRAPPQVHVSADREVGRWVVAIEDNGIGIAEKHHEDIFEIFRRLHSQQAYPGTGIGLAICHRVVQRHGGRIWVESAPGEGCVFRFTLPDQPG